MRKHIMIVITVICLCFIITSFTCKSNAIGLDAITNPDDYIQSSEDNEGALKIGNVIVWVVRTIGESIAVVMLLIIGIKYILGSVEERAEYKKSMWPYVIGAALIFAGAALTDIIYKMFN